MGWICNHWTEHLRNCGLPCVHLYILEFTQGTDGGRIEWPVPGFLGGGFQAWFEGPLDHLFRYAFLGRVESLFGGSFASEIRYPFWGDFWGPFWESFGDVFCGRFRVPWGGAWRPSCEVSGRGLGGDFEGCQGRWGERWVFENHWAPNCLVRIPYICRDQSWANSREVSIFLVGALYGIRTKQIGATRFVKTDAYKFLGRNP